MLNVTSPATPILQNSNQKTPFPSPLEFQDATYSVVWNLLESPKEHLIWIQPKIGYINFAIKITLLGSWSQYTPAILVGPTQAKKGIASIFTPIGNSLRMKTSTSPWMSLNQSIFVQREWHLSLWPSIDIVTI